MQKRLSHLALAVLCMLTATAAVAKNGYHIQLKLTDVKDSMVYLAHYYGQPLPKIYKSDSALIDKNGVAVFDTKEEITGAISFWYAACFWPKPFKNLI